MLAGLETASARTPAVATCAAAAADPEEMVPFEDRRMDVLRVELAAQPTAELRRRARVAGLAPTDIDEALAAPNPKQRLIEHLAARPRPLDLDLRGKAAPAAEQEPEQEPECVTPSSARSATDGWCMLEEPPTPDRVGRAHTDSDRGLWCDIDAAETVHDEGGKAFTQYHVALSLRRADHDQDKYKDEGGGALHWTAKRHYSEFVALRRALLADPALPPLRLPELPT